MLFNLRQITLDSRKEKHTIKVKSLIKQNFHNFEDLCRNNSRFRRFFEQNKDSLVKEKKFYTSNIEVKYPTHINEFYDKCEFIINYIKNVFDTIIAK
jgi:hypothetical protein